MGVFDVCNQFFLLDNNPLGGRREDAHTSSSVIGYVRSPKHEFGCFGPLFFVFKEQTHYPGTHAPQADLGWKLRDISCFSILVPLVTFSMRMTRSHQHA